MNNVEACNLALSRIGHGAQRAIQSLDPLEDTEQAQACDRVFAPIFRAMLTEFSWPFARVSAALAENTFDAPSGWQHSYRMPANALGMRYVEIDGFVPDWLGLSEHRSRWEVMADPSADGKIICTDHALAFAFYTKEITQLTFTDELFADAFAWRLAGEVALGLKADAKLSQWAGQMYRQTLDIAVCVAMNQAGGQMRPAAESIAVRSAYVRDPWCNWRGWPT